MLPIASARYRIFILWVMDSIINANAYSIGLQSYFLTFLNMIKAYVKMLSPTGKPWLGTSQVTYSHQTYWNVWKLPNMATRWWVVWVISNVTPLCTFKFGITATATVAGMPNLSSPWRCIHNELLDVIYQDITFF